MESKCISDLVFGAFVDGELSAPCRVEVEAHVDVCGTCRGVLAALASLSSGAAPLPTQSSSTIANVCAPEIEIGESIGRYIILQKVGAGGMGVVYAAYDPQLDRKIALKLHKFANSNRQSKLQERLLREAKVLACLNHPNIVTVHDVGWARDSLFIAMNFVDGGTIGDHCRRGDLSWRQVLSLFLQAARGLQAAHEKGIVHRDVKPDNLLISKEGQVMVSDFGIARQAGSSSKPLSTLTARSSTLTQAGSRLGTPAYMAPEQHQGRIADARADQFSFAVTLYEALCGERPFRGKGSEELLGAIRQGPARFSTRELPSGLYRLLAKGLSFEPEDRYADMAEFAGALDALRSRSRRKVFAIGLGAAAIVGAFATFFIFSNDRPPSFCEQEAVQAAGMFSPETEEAIAQHFATTVPYGSEIFEKVRPLLHEYREDLSELYSATCKSAGDKGHSRAEIQAQRLPCLYQRRQDLRLFTEDLRQAEPGLIEKSYQSALYLNPVSECQRSQVTADEHGLSPELLAIRTTIAELGSLLRTGEIEKAEARLPQLASALASLPAGRLALELSLRMAQIESRAGRIEEASAHFHQAAGQAMALGDTLKLAETWSYLVDLLSTKEKRPDEGLQLAQWALEAMDAADAPPAMKAQLFSSRGHAHLAAGDFEKADADYQRALALHESEHGRSHYLVARALSNRAGALGALGRHQEVEPLLAEALDIYRLRLGTKHPEYAILLEEQALTASALGNYDHAINLMHEVLSIRRKSLGAKHIDVGKALTNLGFILRKKGDYSGAITATKESIDIKKTVLGAQHPDVATSIANLGNILGSQGDFEGALSLHQEALEIARQALGEAHPQTALAYYSLAVAHNFLQHPKLALENLQRAEESYQSRFPNGHPQLRALLSMKAKVFSNLDRPEEALPIYHSLIVSFPPEQKDLLELASLHFELGQTEWTLGQRRSAVDNARQSLRLLRDGERDSQARDEVRAWLASHTL